MILFEDAEVEVNSLTQALRFLWLAALTLPVGFYLMNRFAPSAERQLAPWRGRHVLLAGSLALLLPPLLIDAEALSHPLGPVLFGQAGLACACAAALFLARRTETGMQVMGFLPDRNLRTIAVAVPVYLCAAPAILGLGGLWVRFAEERGWGAEQEVLERMLQLQGGEALAGAVLAVLIAPCLEELFFRGFAQPAFVRMLGSRGGVVLTAILFGAIHGRVAAVPVAALALLLGALQERTGRLIAPITVHVVHNALILYAARMAAD